MTSELNWMDLTIGIDTREQLPLEFGSMKTQRVSLDLADYTVVGLESSVRIERKSLDDLLACVGRERPRFDRGVERLRAYETRAVVVESTWESLELGEWRSQLKPAHVVGSVCGWIAKGVPVLLVGDRHRASKVIARLCFIAAKRRWRESRAFTRAMEIAHD